MTANVGTFWNALPTGLTSLTIQGIVGSPTGYNVYDGNGVLVASASWPSLVTPTLHGDVSGSVSMGSTLTLTPPGTPAIGDTLVVIGGLDNSPSGFTASCANVATWQYLGDNGDSFQPVAAIGRVTSTGGSWAVSVSTAGGSGTMYGTLSWWSGLTAYSLVDVQGRTNTASPPVSPLAMPTLTPNGNGELWIAGLMGNGPSWGTPSSLFTNFPSTSSTAFRAAYYQQTTAASPSVNFPFTGGGGYCFCYTFVLAPAVGGSTLVIPAPSGTWKPGYYYIDCVGPTLGANGYSVDSVQVTIMRDLGKLPSPSALPALGTDPAIGTPNKENEDLYLHGWLAHGPERYSIVNTAAPTTDAPSVGGFGRTIAGIETGIAAEKSTGLYLAAGQADPARPRPLIVNFPADWTTDIGGGAVAPATYEAGVQATVAALGPGTTSNVTYFEGLNEPNVVIGDSASWPTIFEHLYTGMIAGSASAKAVGPALSSGGPNGSNGNTAPQVSQVTDFLSALSGATAGGISTHNYHGWTADPFVVEGWLSALRAATTAAGSVPIFCTELGNIYRGPLWTGTQSSMITDRRVVAATATSYLAAERSGVPKEQLLYFYDTFQGGQEVYSGLKDSDGSLTPQATFFRVYSEELWGKAWTRSLSFGTAGDNFYRGEVFSEGSSGSGTGAVVALYAPGMVTESVTLSNVGSSTVVVSDWLGNTTNYTPSSGTITVPITDLPTYVRIPLAQAASVAVSAVGGGIGTATNLASSATAKAGSNPASLTTQALLNDGLMQTGGLLYQGGGADYNYTSTTVPHYVELDWGTSKTLNHVVIRQANPWAQWPVGGGGASAMLTGKIEYWNGSAWVACPTTPGDHWDALGNYSNTTANEFLTSIGHNPGFVLVYSQWDQNWVNHVTLSAPVSTTKLRLTISTVSNTNFVNNAIENDTTPTVTLSEVQAFYVAPPATPSGRLVSHGGHHYRLA